MTPKKRGKTEVIPKRPDAEALIAEVHDSAAWSFVPSHHKLRDILEFGLIEEPRFRTEVFKLLDNVDLDPSGQNLLAEVAHLSYHGKFAKAKKSLIEIEDIFEPMAQKKLYDEIELSSEIPVTPVRADAIVCAKIDTLPKKRLTKKQLSDVKSALLGDATKLVQQHLDLFKKDKDPVTAKRFAASLSKKDKPFQKTVERHTVAVRTPKRKK